MLPMNDYRPGMAFKMNGEVYVVVKWQHVKPGKGQAFVRAKIRNLSTGALVEKTFRPEDKFEQVILEEKSASFSYKQGSTYHFLDNETYEMVELDEEAVGEAKKYLKENMEVYLLYMDGVPMGVKLPNFVELEVVETAPGIKGDTVSGGSKPATLETGAVINVPLFVNVGDVIKIDTRTDEYVERVK